MLDLAQEHVLLAERDTQVHLGLHAGRDVAQDFQILLAPFARLVADRAEGAHHVAVPGSHRNAQIGDHVEIDDRAVVANERMRPRVGHDQRLRPVDDVLAEGMAERRFASRRGRGRQASGGLEELPVRVDHREQGDGGAEQSRGEPHGAVEIGFPFAVEQFRALHGGEPQRIERGARGVGSDA